MFVNIVHFPPIKESKEAAFREWFAWSNVTYAKHNGFISRRLLKPLKGGTYAAIVEHQSQETFMAMHTSDDQKDAHRRVEPLFDGKPSAEFFEVLPD